MYKIDEHSGQAFIAMEFLDGVTLKRHIGGKPVETDALLGLAIKVADQLDAAILRATSTATLSLPTFSSPNEGTR